MNLLDMTKLNEFCNSFLNNRELSWTEGWVTAGNRPCVTSVNLTLIVLNRRCYTFFAEDTPVLLDKISEFKLAGRCEVRYAKVFTKHVTMYGLIVVKAKVWVYVSQGRRRVKAFAYKASSLHLWEH